MGPAAVSLSRLVSATRDPTTYGSIFDAGLLSSIYPLPAAFAVEVGILKEAARFATPNEKTWQLEVS